MACDRRNAPLTFTAASYMFLRPQASRVARVVYVFCIQTHVCAYRIRTNKGMDMWIRDSWTPAIKRVELDTSCALLLLRGPEGPYPPDSITSSRPAVDLYVIVKSDARHRARQRAHHLLHAFRYLQATTCRAHRWIFTYSLYSPRVPWNVTSGSVDRSHRAREIRSRNPRVRRNSRSP